MKKTLKMILESVLILEVIFCFIRILKYLIKTPTEHEFATSIQIICLFSLSVLGYALLLKVVLRYIVDKADKNE